MSLTADDILSKMRECYAGVSPDEAYVLAVQLQAAATILFARAGVNPPAASPSSPSPGSASQHDGAATGIKVSVDPEAQETMSALGEELTAPPKCATNYADLRTLILRDYRNNGLKLKGLTTRLIHLDPFFERFKIAQIRSDTFDRYIERRRREGASNASINRERCVLHRMFVLGSRTGANIAMPYFAKLKEPPPRSGFFEADEFARVLSHLPEYLKPPMEAGYHTGWRIQEILTRRREHVDLGDGSSQGWLRIDPGESKTGKARMFPLTPGSALRNVVVKQLRQCESLGTEFLFHQPNGRKINASLYWHWGQACVKAGVPNRIPHDFRRTAYRNLLRAGIPKEIAMAWIGHETDAMAKRYAILDEGLMGEFASKLAGGALPVASSAPSSAPTR